MGSGARIRVIIAGRRATDLLQSSNANAANPSGGVHLGEIVVFLRVVAIALDVLSLDETLDALF